MRTGTSQSAVSKVQRGKLLYRVPENVLDASNMGQFCRWLTSTRGLEFATYADVWRWSVDELEGFWQALVDYFKLELGDYRAVLTHTDLPPGKWFPGAKLSYPAQILKHVGDGPAIVGLSQTRARSELSRDGLRDAVARCAAGLKRANVVPGDVVAAYLPNIPEAVVAMLATASIGAIWVSCAPEFGVKAVVDRLRQVEPRVLLAVGGYCFGDKAIDRRQQVAQVRQSIESIETVIDVPYLDGYAIEQAVSWQSLLEVIEPLDFHLCDFDHPLYILFSSGTTGLPKAIVHSHGGILLEHLKALGLHNDVREGDVFFWFSTTGWMVWNYSVSALLHGACLVCFDGNPLYPDANALWELAQDEKVSYFGNSATFYMTCQSLRLAPARDFELGAINTIGSTGSPLAPAGFEWLADQFGDRVVIASVAGGTDICSAFLGASPMVEIRSGELAAPMLGCRVKSLDESGAFVIDIPGELVVDTPMPSMPVRFWNDPQDQRYLAAYFEQNPGLWTHGDWIIMHEDNSAIITGRSDSTLNRGGVRMGTADFYNLIETMRDVADSMIVHIEDQSGGLGQLILFLVMSGDGDKAQIESSIRQRLREELSPRHVPDSIAWLSAIPRTLTGKKIETPVKRILQGERLVRVTTLESLTNAHAVHEILAWFEENLALRNG